VFRNPFIESTSWLRNTMPRSWSILGLGLVSLILLIGGCRSTRGQNTFVSDDRPASATQRTNPVRPVEHESLTADDSVVLEPDSGDASRLSRWKELLNPFAKKKRIPLPLSPKADDGDDRPFDGF